MAVVLRPVAEVHAESYWHRISNVRVGEMSALVSTKSPDPPPGEKTKRTMPELFESFVSVHQNKTTVN